MVALASLHELFENDDNSILSSNHDLAHGGFALQQYNCAISCLIKPVTDGGQQTVDTLLVACILFACFEVHPSYKIVTCSNGQVIIDLRNNPDWFADSTRPLWVGRISHSEWRQNNLYCERRSYQRTSNHFFSTEGLYNALCSSRNFESHICSSRLPIESGKCVAASTIMSAGLLTSSQLVGGPPMPLEIDPKSSPPGFSPHIPVSFNSLEEAQNSLCFYQNRCLKAAYYLDDAILQTKSIGPFIEDAYIESFRNSRGVFRRLLKEWSSAFEAYLTKASATMDTKALQGAAVLKINHRMFELQVEHHAQNRLQSSQSCDFSQRECEEIVDLATTVVTTHDQSSSSSPPKKPMFCIDMNIVIPLFAIAHRCRDPVVRRRVIALLNSAPRGKRVYGTVS